MTQMHLYVKTSLASLDKLSVKLHKNEAVILFDNNLLKTIISIDSISVSILQFTEFVRFVLYVQYCM